MEVKKKSSKTEPRNVELRKVLVELKAALQQLSTVVARVDDLLKNASSVDEEENFLSAEEDLEETDEPAVNKTKSVEVIGNNNLQNGCAPTPKPRKPIKIGTRQSSFNEAINRTLLQKVNEERSSENDTTSNTVQNVRGKFEPKLVRTRSVNEYSTKVFNADTSEQNGDGGIDVKSLKNMFEMKKKKTEPVVRKGRFRTDEVNISPQDLEKRQKVLKYFQAIEK